MTSTEVLTVPQMTKADQLTIAAGISGVELMENAGAAVAREIIARWPPCQVAVLCGPGNNGGDGFVVARHLLAAGYHVRLALLGATESLKGDAAHHAGLCSVSAEAMTPDVLENAQLVVDALFGSGLTRPIEGPALDVLNVAQKQAPIVAIDVPSGVLGDTGEALGAVQSALTITFSRKKPGHLLFPGRRLAGEIVVADIGTSQHIIDKTVPNVFENAPSLWRRELPLLSDDSHKYSRGHALIWGGYPTTGAARLAARATARMGAGLTTVAFASIALPIYTSALTSIMVRPIDGSAEFSELLTEKRFTAFLIGPGSGIGAETKAKALAMLWTQKPTVLDADALTSFQSIPSDLDGAIKGPCVLTPHEGEFARLFDDTGDKLSRARAAARRCGATIILKGADTIIAAPDGRAIINSNAPPTLATAGSGDVLAGFVTSLLAQGMNSFLASAAAVWMHGAAGTLFGPGLIAEDLPEILPQVLRELDN
jgi:ADP-dependent NAD(P)H-hydrate dehydratase / NAD(P)H-hydrate epimerase